MDYSENTKWLNENVPNLDRGQTHHVAHGHIKAYIETLLDAVRSLEEEVGELNDIVNVVEDQI